MLRSGETFADRFEIDRAAGSGGMGTVYRARDRHSGEFVALKLVHYPRTEPQRLHPSHDDARFTREAQLLSELRHPGIVTHIAHSETLQGQPFLAMEWLDGEDLAQRLARGPLPIGETLTFITRVTEALAFAHSHGVVHRDLKPSNIFLKDYDLARPKLLDFGIARRTLDSRTMTRTGTIIGTPEYMAPEQARGEKNLTATADVFSLGCVLYECFAGKSPFSSEHIAAMLVRILFEEPAPLESRRPGIPAPLSQLVQRMLVKDPAQRIRDANEFLAQLIALGPVHAEVTHPTLEMTSEATGSFAQSEQALFSLVVASPPQQAEPGPTSADPAAIDAAHDKDPHGALLSALRTLGVQADYLIDGSLVATVPRTGNVTDQVGLAAQAALLIKARWPEAEVVVATGRGVASDATAVGEVAISAASLVQERKAQRTARNAKTHSDILLDPLSAQLLGPRFTVRKDAHSVLLVGEEKEADASRPLLGKPTPCVGRDVELSTLEAQLGACIEESQAQAVLISAPSGVGKSRLRHEFLRRLEKRPDPVTVLLGRGELATAGAPYAILRQALRRYCGLSGSEPIPTQRLHLGERIGRHVAAAEQSRVAVYLCELAGLSVPDEEAPWLRAVRKDPKLMVEGISRAFLTWLAAECRAAPILVILDDFQWGDGLTLALLEGALRELHGLPFFMLIFARPEIHGVFPQLRQNQRLSEMSLKALSKKACERLIQHLLGKDVAPEAVARAIEQAAGNALYLEELIRAMAAGETAGSKEVPETVVAMLQARIGKFETGPRRAVRAAAVFGRTFWADGVAGILGLRGASSAVDNWLTQLVHAEIIERRKDSRLPGQTEYVFRHSLVRDAAYGLLTESDRLTGHRMAGEFLEAATGEHDAGAIAEHYVRGGELSRAVRLHERAGDEAARLCLYPKAREHFEQAQALLQKLPDSLAFRRIRVDLLLKYVQSGLLPEAHDLNLQRLEAGRALLQDATGLDKPPNEDRLRLARMDYWCGRVQYQGGQRSEAIKYFKRVLAVAQELGDVDLLMVTAHWRRMAAASNHQP